MAGAMQVASLFGVLELKDNMSGALDQARGKMDTFSAGGKLARGAMIGIGAGATAMAAGLGIAIGEAMEAEVNIAKLDAVLKATGGTAGVSKKQLLDHATALSRVTRFSDDAVIQGQTMLLTFKEIGSETFPDATEAMLDMSEMMGMDTTQAAVMLGKALNDPVEGITALKRVGVQLTEAQEDQIASMVEMNDIAGAQAIILGEINSQMGGVAEAAGDTLAGKLTIAKNRLLDFAETAGMEIIPHLENFADMAIEGIGTGIDAIEAAYETGGLEGVADLLLSSLETGLGDLAVWVEDEIVTPVVDYLKGVDWGEVANTLGNLLEKFISFEASIITSAATWLYDEIITPIVDYLGTVNWTAVGNRLSEMLDKFLGVAASGITAVGTWVWNEILQPLSSYLSNVNWAGVASRLLEVLEKMLGYAAAGIAGIGVWLWQNIIEPLGSYLSNVDWAGVASRLLEVLGKMLGFAAAGIASVGAWAYDNIIQPIIDKMKDPATWASLFDSAKELGGQIFDGLLAALSGLARELAQLIDDALPNHVNFGTIHVPDMGPLGGGYDKTIGLDIPDNPITSLMGMDQGGMGRAGTPYYIGTGAQPELFVPQSAGTFYPAGTYGGTSISIGAVFVQDEDPGRWLDRLEREASRRNLTLGVARG